jgi:hypothetical protein
MDVPEGETYHHHLRIICSSRNYCYVGGGLRFAHVFLLQNEQLMDSHKVVVHDVTPSFWQRKTPLEGDQQYFALLNEGMPTAN